MYKFRILYYNFVHIETFQINNKVWKLDDIRKGFIYISVKNVLPFYLTPISHPSGLEISFQCALQCPTFEKLINL